MSADPTTELGPREARLRRELGSLYPFAPQVFRRDREGPLVHFVDEGPRSNTAVLFLHGNPTWSFAWRAPIAALLDRFRCVAPDMLGCGLSDKPQHFDYCLAEHTETVCRLVEYLGLERVHLVVHDWGGAIGMGFARRAPDRIASITALNTAAFLGGRLPRRIGVLRTPLLGTLLMRGLGVFSKSAVRSTTTRTELAPLVRRAYLGPYANWHDRVAVDAFVRDIPTDPSHRSYAELAATDARVADFAHVPTQLIWGERDWCFTPRFREEWQRRWPNTEVHRIEDAAHFVFEDAPEEVSSHLAEFLERNWSSAGAIQRAGASRG